MCGAVPRMTISTDSINRYVSRGAYVESRQGGGFTVNLKCEDCDHDHAALHIGTVLGPQAIASKLRQRGWRIGTHSRCPDHKHVRNETVNAPLPKPLIVLPTPVTSTEKAREAKRLAMMALEEAFVIETGQYRDGKTDTSIGKEYGLAVAAVAKMREEFFGPLKPTGEFTKMREELAAKVAQIDALKNDVSAALRRLDGIAVQRGWTS